MSVLIAYNLSKYRKLNNMTQQQLSDNLTDVSKPSITLYEKNQRTPSNDVQNKICSALNISKDVLNGKNEIELYECKIRNELLADKINHNDYIYLCNFIKDFFDFEKYEETKKKSSFVKYSFSNISREFLKTPDYIKGYAMHIYDEDLNKQKQLMEYIFIVLNLFVDLTLTLIKENHTQYTSQQIHSYKIFSGVDVKLTKGLVELKPKFLDILDSLNSIESLKNYTIPVYGENIKEIIDYTLITPNFSKQISILSAIKIRNDYMSPRFEKDDLIIIRESSNYETGDYVAIADKDKIYIGKLKIDEKIRILQPLNTTNYAPNIFSKDCKILGKIIETRYN